MYNTNSPQGPNLSEGIVKSFLFLFIANFTGERKPPALRLYFFRNILFPFRKMLFRYQKSDIYTFQQFWAKHKHIQHEIKQNSIRCSLQILLPGKTLPVLMMVKIRNIWWCSKGEPMSDARRWRHRSVYWAACVLKSCLCKSAQSNQAVTNESQRSKLVQSHVTPKTRTIWHNWTHRGRGLNNQANKPQVEHSGN